MLPPTNAFRRLAAAALLLAVARAGAQIPLLSESFDGTPTWFAYSGDAGVTHSRTHAPNGPDGSSSLNLAIQVASGSAYWYGGTGVSRSGAFPAVPSQRPDVRVRLDLWTNRAVAGGIEIIFKNPGAPAGQRLSLRVDAPGTTWTRIDTTLREFVDTGFDFDASAWELLVTAANTSGWGTSGTFELRIDNVLIALPGTLPPSIGPAGGVYRDPVLVTLSTATPGALIRYSLDGSEPTATSGTVYTAPFPVDGVTTVRAVAYVGSAVSTTTSRRYIVVPSAQSRPLASDRGRVRVVSVPDPLGSQPTNPATQGLTAAPLKVLRTDQGTPLRGPSPWIYRSLNVAAGDPSALAAAIPASFPAAIRSGGANSLRLVIFDAYNQGTASPPYPDLTDPGQMENLLVQIERWVDLASEQGLYVCINFHTPYYNTAGPIQETYATRFWEVVAPYFRNRTHVLYEPTNEAGASIQTFAPYVNGGAEMAKQVRLYRVVRERAPETMVLMLTPAQVDEFYTFNAIVASFDRDVASLTGMGVDWERTAVGYHVYFSPTNSTDEMRGIHKAYPAFFTEAGFAQDMNLGPLEWSPGLDGFRLAAQAAERLGIGFWQWTTDNEARFLANWPLLTQDAVAKGWMWTPDAVQPPPTEAPRFSIPAGIATGPIHVALQTSTPGASIRYTTDGSIPSSTSGVLYTGSPVRIDATTTILAIAFRPGRQDSPLAAATYTFAPAGSLVRVNAAGPAVNPFAADTGFSGGSLANWSAPIDRPDPLSAPLEVYQTERWSASGMVFMSPPLPDGRYEVRLHFAENWAASAGARRFHLAINGARSGSLYTPNFDVFAAAGNRMRTAVVRRFLDVAPGTDGRIVVELLPGTANNPMINGVEILPLQVSTPVATPGAQASYLPLDIALASDTPLATVRHTIDGPLPSGTSGALYTGPFRLARTGTVLAVASRPGWLDSPPLVARYVFPDVTGTVRVNAAGPAAATFSPDAGFQPTNVASTSLPISLSGVADAAPEAVYQTERWSTGPIVYTSPPLVGPRTYTVRLHFAENWATQPGQRRFHVAIQGQRRLSDFDPYAESGGQRRAIVRTFRSVPPDADGRIVVVFEPGSANNPMINGVEVLAEQDPWSLWRAAHFTAAELLTAEVSGAGAAPLGDGIVNLQKFAFNLAPRDVARTLPAVGGEIGLPRLDIEEVAGERHLVLEFLRRTDAALVYTPEFSVDPGFTSVGTGQLLSITPLAPPWERVRVRDLVPVPDRGVRFGRVRISSSLTP